MKCVKVKVVRVWSNGAVTLENISLKPITQSVFYEKDKMNATFSQKEKTFNLFQNLSSTSYKSKYRL